MATYNGSRYLREQLNSILCQLLPNDELIVSDDNSTDDTRSIVESYKDRRILLICNPSTRGHIRNFANAMAKARGEFIVLSDQDDIWVEHRLERMLRLLQRSPQSSLAVGDLVELDQRGLRRVERRLGPSPSSNQYQLIRVFLGKAKYFGSAFVFHRSLMRYVLPIPASVEAHDIWIAMNACIHGGVVHLEETTLLRRLHGGNLTPERRRALPAILRSRLRYCWALLQTCLR